LVLSSVLIKLRLELSQSSYFSPGILIGYSSIGPFFFLSIRRNEFIR